MLYREVFDKISTEFRGISLISLNFQAPRPREISEGLFITFHYRGPAEGWHRS